MDKTLTSTPQIQKHCKSPLLLRHKDRLWRKNLDSALQEGPLTDQDKHFYKKGALHLRMAIFFSPKGAVDFHQHSECKFRKC